MERITMSHGAGGTIMQDLIVRIILKNLGGSNAEVPLEALDDSAVIDNIVLKSDSHTVKPLFFPGGNIGRCPLPRICESRLSQFGHQVNAQLGISTDCDDDHFTQSPWGGYGRDWDRSHHIIQEERP